MIAPRTLERGQTSPGCDDRCRVERIVLPGADGCIRLTLHAPEPHEAYGRTRALAGGLRGEAVIRAGRLVVDRWQRAAFVDGAILHLAGREWELLEYLAINAGRFCPLAQIRVAVWGQWSSENVPRTYLTRLRSQLGVCADLIETRHHHGYRLRLDPPIVAGSAPVADQPAPHRWSRQHDACVCCGQTDRPHEGYGRCGRCRRSGGRPHHGPCRAPKEVRGVQP